ncbi:uncharacterized protein HD556DRAFT_1374166 [Suillus plorans]|uniref:Uncharacterized protein n=1 Tax=Suillus plorans TaxID=116603 RepID=A0A9P7AQS8_9AGAM|nr:uncharacterized protein HD556DRAFT_1374166 [Suillus plorans]KAG1793457.1 hypothetical protein HD556DRAFT_1374166 [Suillus plorans]
MCSLKGLRSQILSDTRRRFLLRRVSFSKDQYRPFTPWASYTLLPNDISAVVTFAFGCGDLVPSMSQACYAGPVARHGNGNIGVYVGFCGGGLVSHTRWQGVPKIVVYEDE